MSRYGVIGIVGGMSPESTATYYRHIVRRHQEEFHDHSYPRIVIASVSFQPYIEWQHHGEWDRIASELQGEFASVAAAGADFAVLATNTMHKVLRDIRSPIPVLSIFDAVASAAQARSLRRLGLTGTKFTMSDGFYQEALASRGFDVLTPEDDEQEVIHTIIYEELIRGVVLRGSVARFDEIAGRLVERGAEEVLLACTELQLLAEAPGFRTPTLDTARLHAESAWEAAIGRRSPY